MVGDVDGFGNAFLSRSLRLCCGDRRRSRSRSSRYVAGAGGGDVGKILKGFSLNLAFLSITSGRKPQSYLLLGVVTVVQRLVDINTGRDVVKGRTATWTASSSSCCFDGLEVMLVKKPVGI